MNNLKIQQDILKLLFSKPESVIYHPLRDGSGIAIGTKYAFFVIPTDEFFLNLGFIKSSSAIIDCLDRRYSRDYKLAEFVGYDELKGKHKVGIFKSEKGYIVIDRKYLSYFKGDTLSLYIDESSRLSPALVYDDYYNPLAVIFGINVRIEEFLKHE